MSGRRSKRKPKTSGSKENQKYLEEEVKENQKRLEEELKEIHSKINIFANQQTPSRKKPEENNNKSIMEYREKIITT